MKKLLLPFISAFALSISSCNSDGGNGSDGATQGPSIQWQKVFGGSSSDYASSVKLTSDGGYIFIGYTLSNDGDIIGNHGGYDYWVVKLDNNGLVQWKKTYGGSFLEFAYSIEPTQDGGYILGGYTQSNNGDVTGNHGLNDAWVVKIDANGTIQWQKTLGGSGTDEANQVQPTIDGGYIVIGNTDPSSWAIKLDSNGSIQWQKTLDGSISGSPKSVQQTVDGGYIIAGTTYYHGGDAWVLKLNSSGIIEWQKTFGGIGSDEANQVQLTTDGGYIIAGTASNDGDANAWVIKINSNGDIQWQKTLGGSKSDTANSIQQTIDGGYIFAGETYSKDGDVSGLHGNSKDAWVVKLNGSGVIQWQKALGGTSSDHFTTIASTVDGGCIVLGETTSYNGDLSEVNLSIPRDKIWLVKL